MALRSIDLMMDDWVQIVPDAPIMANEYHRIDWIRTGEVGLDNRKIVTYPYIQPIPLTPEILEKNGFIPAANGVSWHLRDDDTDECLLVLNKIHNAFVMSTAGMTIGFQYVHQLQHLLRLCGINKEIIL